MAIDFPSSPTNGQTFGNWIYDSAITAWRNVKTDSGVSTLNAMGVKNIVPSSVVVGSGSATTNVNGLVTYSSVSSISLNGVFSSSYKHYKIKISATGGSAQNTVYMRMRASGTDLATNNYNFASTAMRDSNTSFGLSGTGLSAFWLNYHNGPATGQGTGSTTVELFNPKETYTSATWSSRGSDATSALFLTGGGTLYSGNYDGFTIFPSTGTFSGSISIYGYSN